MIEELEAGRGGIFIFNFVVWSPTLADDMVLYFIIYILFGQNGKYMLGFFKTMEILRLLSTQNLTLKNTCSKLNFKHVDS